MSGCRTSHVPHPSARQAVEPQGCAAGSFPGPATGKMPVHQDQPAALGVKILENSFFRDGCGAVLMDRLLVSVADAFKEQAVAGVIRVGRVERPQGFYIRPATDFSADIRYGVGGWQVVGFGQLEMRLMARGKRRIGHFCMSPEHHENGHHHGIVGQQLAQDSFV